MKQIQNKTLCDPQRGSAFFYILLGVVLFGALAFTVSRGMRSQTTSTITNREADLFASDILLYAKKVEHAVSRVMQNRGVDAGSISFYNRFTDLTDYENGSCSDEKCLVFNSAGGGLTWLEPPEGASDFAWHFTNTHLIPGYDGTGNAGIVLHLPDINAKLCETINKQLGYDFPETPRFSGSLAADSFTGSYASGTEVTCGDGYCEDKPAACIQVEGSYSAEGETMDDGYLFYYGIYVMPSDF